MVSAELRVGRRGDKVEGLKMSVLMRLIEERAEWAEGRGRSRVSRDRWLVVQFIVLLAIGLGVVIHYQRILAVLMAVLGAGR